MPLGKDAAGRTRGPSSAQRAVNARQAAAKGPLRAVIATGEGADPARRVDVDVLECGHSLSYARDLIGRRYPARRRCWKCGKGRPPDVDPADYE